MSLISKTYTTSAGANPRRAWWLRTYMYTTGDGADPQESLVRSLMYTTVNGADLQVSIDSDSVGYNLVCVYSLLYSPVQIIHFHTSHIDDYRCTGIYKHFFSFYVSVGWNRENHSDHYWWLSMYWHNLALFSVYVSVRWMRENSSDQYGWLSDVLAYLSISFHFRFSRMKPRKSLRSVFSWAPNSFLMLVSIQRKLSGIPNNTYTWMKCNLQLISSFVSMLIIWLHQIEYTLIVLSRSPDKKLSIRNRSKWKNELDDCNINTISVINRTFWKEH